MGNGSVDAGEMGMTARIYCSGGGKSSIGVSSSFCITTTCLGKAQLFERPFPLKLIGHSLAW